MPSLRSVTDNDSYAINMKYSGGFTKVFHPVHLRCGISTLFFLQENSPQRKKLREKKALSVRRLLIVKLDNQRANF